VNERPAGLLGLEPGLGAPAHQLVVWRQLGVDLRVPQPVGDERRQVSQSSAERRGFAGPFREGGRLVEGEHAPAAGFGVEAVGEEGFDAGALVEERQRLVPGRRDVGQAGAVLFGLKLDAAEGCAGGLGLDGADGFAVHEQQVAGEAGLEGEFAHDEQHGSLDGRIDDPLIRVIHVLIQPPAPGLGGGRRCSAVGRLFFGRAVRVWSWSKAPSSKMRQL